MARLQFWPAVLLIGAVACRGVAYRPVAWEPVASWHCLDWKSRSGIERHSFVRALAFCDFGGDPGDRLAQFTERRRRTGAARDSDHHQRDIGGVEE